MKNLAKKLTEDFCEEVLGVPLEEIESITVHRKRKYWFTTTSIVTTNIITATTTGTNSFNYKCVV